MSLLNVGVESNLNLINKIVEKLAVDASDKLIKKSCEYLRLLRLKRSAGSMNLSDTCAVVICLNLAAEKLGCSPFDKACAAKVGGVNKKNYANFYHTVEKVLGLDKRVTVGELCVKLACSDMSDLAQRLIDKYVRNREEGLVKGPPIDLSHPMYACAAVLAACKHKKVRVKREALVDLCRVKARDLDKLAAELAALAEQADKQPSRKRGHHLIEMVEQMVKESQKSAKNKEEEEEEEKDDKPKESFEEWKKRILDKAANT